MVFDRCYSGKKTHDPRRASRVKKLWVYFEEALPSRMNAILLTKTVASSHVSASLLAVTPVVAGASLLSPSPPPEICPQISRLWDCAVEEL